METTTSFDLNQAIQQWRDNLGQSPALRRENLDELESHLRDSVMALEGRGLSAAEAFCVATRRVGASQTLEPEFGKVNGQAIWFDRLFWMLIGYHLWIFVSHAIGIVTVNAVNLGLLGAGYDFKSHGYTIPATLFALVQMAAFAGSLALCWWLLCRKGQRLSQSLGRWLYRKTTWALTFCVFYVLWFFVVGFSGLANALYARSIGQEDFGAMSLSHSISSMATNLITTAVFIGLTLFLARKRICMTESQRLA